MPEMAPVTPEVPVTPAMPEVAPVTPEVPVMPTMPEVAPVTPEVPVMPETQNGPIIYGGANPTASVNDVNVNVNQPHQIYGGADPLENTQPMPNIQPVQQVSSVQPASVPTMTSADVTIPPVQQ